MGVSVLRGWKPVNSESIVDFSVRVRVRAMG